MDSADTTVDDGTSVAREGSFASAARTPNR